MAFTVLVKFYSIEYFCNIKVPGLGKIFGYTVVCWNVHGYFTAVSPFYGPIDMTLPVNSGYHALLHEL